MVETKGDIENYISNFNCEMPKEEIWDTDRYLRYMPDAIGSIREEIGDELKILHDVHHRLLPREAAAFAKELEQYKLFWLEDPTPAEDQDALKLLRRHSTIPIAIGEVFNSIWDCNKLIQNQLIDYIRVSATYVGSITHVKRIVDFAAMFNVRTRFHGAPSHSPLSMAAQGHLNAWEPNFGIQEYLVLGTKECDDLLPSKH